MERVRFDADQPRRGAVARGGALDLEPRGGGTADGAAQGRGRARHRAPAFLHVPAHAGHPRAARRAPRADRPDLPRLRAHLRQPAPVQPSREPPLRGMPPARAAGAALDALHEEAPSRRAPPVAPPVARTRSSAAAAQGPAVPHAERIHAAEDDRRRHAGAARLPRAAFHPPGLDRAFAIAGRLHPLHGPARAGEGNRHVPRCRGARARSAVQSGRDRRAGTGRAGARARAGTSATSRCSATATDGNSSRSCAARAPSWCPRSGTSRSRLLSLRRWRRRGR